ncbi:bifunctional adenosylcobinamide kinase/adenosylcobinamide-phosphate guanylyltransferase [Microtetraspora malaysiensis]|uniref:bifunctional adenosylcobinamide kinase/adenosylcobinamide-phosphate guanylyltransferase n=1 Tax=Microtetraspora malaysiensis TaxID=161358 RepID=UPI003D8D3E8A
MRIVLEGTAGPEGWPSPGCGCASCGRATTLRRPLSIVVDGRIRLVPDGVPAAGDPLSWPEGHLVARTLDGLAVTGPDGGRLLHAGSGLTATASPPPESREEEPPPRPYDVVLIDPLDRPERLGGLRRRGLVTPRTRVVAVGLDHRVPSEGELARRLAFWGVEAVPDGTVVDTRDRPLPTRTAPRRTLLLGGTRSGKSEEAELRLAAEPHVTYVATGPSGGDDLSWLARVQAHRDRRAAHWGTVETTDLAELLRTSSGTLLIDGLGTWIAAVFDECGAWPGYGQDDTHARGAVPEGTEQKTDLSAPDTGRAVAGPSPLDRVALRCDELVEAWRATAAARVVAVSDEVGLGVIPATASGRLFRDTLGRLNQRLARESEDVALVVAGRVLSLPV